MHTAHIPKCHVFSHFLMIIFDYIIDYIFSGHFLMKVFFKAGLARTKKTLL